MNKLDRILVPTDFSAGANAACQYANFLAETFGGTIDLMHRIPTLKYFQDSLKKLGVPLSMERDYMPQVEKTTKANLEADMEKYIHNDHRGKCIAKIGPKSADTILELAHHGKYDIMVLGSRGDSSQQYVKMGSVTTRIVKLSMIPVVAVPEVPALTPIKNIMVPTDYSDESLQALKPAAFMAHKTGAKITLFHVLELYGSLAEAHDIPEGKRTPNGLRERIYNKIRGFLTATEEFDLRLNVGASDKDLSFDYTVNGEVYTIPVAIEIDRGFSAHYQIVSYASEHADFMIISTHGRSGLKHLMLGSTAEKVTQWSEIPVMTHRIKF
ncbi:MAG: universal stress protein [Balneolales bacterium]